MNRRAAVDSAPVYVQSIEWGVVRVAGDGKTHVFKDAVLWPGGAREWDWRESGTRHKPGIHPSAVEELLERDCSIVVLSRGMDLVLETMPETFEGLRLAGVRYEWLQSKQAVERYNALFTAGERVGMLLHSTC
ncbi:MAG: hypothetical protein JNK05_13845 [Myxococcales bacterium]|nr:hypothetical protein [Myxococcales bacterium]